MRYAALASMYQGEVPMKYCPKPWRWRPVHQFLWLVPIGRRWMKRRSGSSQDTAIQPSCRHRWPSMPSHINSRVNPPIWRKQVVRKNLVIPTEFLVADLLRDEARRVGE